MTEQPRIPGRLCLRRRIELSDEDKQQIRNEAADRLRDQPSMTRRMMQHDASERAECGEPYNEREGG